jgi:hypothetical protein
MLTRVMTTLNGGVSGVATGQLPIVAMTSVRQAVMLSALTIHACFSSVSMIACNRSAVDESVR